MVAQIALLGPILGRVARTDYNIAGNIKDLLEDAGFVDIVEHREKLPWSPWMDPDVDPKGHETGNRLMWYYETGIQGWILKPLIDHFEVRKMNSAIRIPQMLILLVQVTREQVDEWCEGAVAELKRNEHHWYSWK